MSNLATLDTLQWCVKSVESLEVQIGTIELVKVWIPIGISVFALTIAGATFLYNWGNNKRNLLRSLIVNLGLAKKSSEDVGNKMAGVLGKKQASAITQSEQFKLDYLMKSLESRNDDVLNQIEIACVSFYGKEVKSKEFRQQFTDDIRRYVDNNKHKYTPPFTSYPKTVQYYEAICKPH
jgi:hypothetical protein